MKILSYNMHKGLGPGFRKGAFLASIREAARATQADLVLLQEVGHDGNEAQFEYLADTVWTHYSYGQNATYPTGHHGNAILSRFPILHSSNLDLSTNRWERRGLLHAIIDWKEMGAPLHALCVHLNLMESGRLVQAERIRNYIEKQIPPDCPLVFAGDLNDWTGRLGSIFEKQLGLKECYRSIHGAYAKTFPSWLPCLPLDRIYHRHFQVREASVLQSKSWRYLSDHLAVHADLSWERSSS